MRGGRKALPLKKRKKELTKFLLCVIITMYLCLEKLLEGRLFCFDAL